MKKRVLIVEANRETALALAAAVRADDVTPSLFHDADGLFADLDKQTPDLIVVAADLPSQSGYSVCNRVRSNERTAAVKVIIVSMRRDDERLAPHRQSPRAADGYVAPPLSWRDLRAEALALLGLEAAMAAADSVSEVEEDPFAHLDRILSPVAGDHAQQTALPPEEEEEKSKPAPEFSDEDLDGALGAFDSSGDRRVEEKTVAAVKSDEPEMMDDEAILEVPEAPTIRSPLSNISDEEMALVARTIGKVKDAGAPPLPPGVKRKEDLKGPDAKIYQLREALREKELELLKLQEIWQRHEREFSESAQLALEKEVEAKSARMELEEIKQKSEELNKHLSKREREYSSSSDRLLEEKVLLEKDLIEVVASKEKTVAELRRMLSARERDLSDTKQTLDKVRFESDATLVETKAAYEQQLAALRNELQAERTRAAEAEAAQRQDAEKRIADQQQQHEEILASVRGEHLLASNEAQQKHDAEVAELKEAHRAATDRATVERAAEEERLNTQLRDDTQRLTTRLQEEAERLQSERRDSDERFAQEVARLQGQLDEEKNRAIATRAELEESVRHRTESLNDAQSQLRAMNEDNGTLKQRTGELEAKLEESVRNLESKDSGLRRVAAELAEVKAMLLEREQQLGALREESKNKETKDLQQTSELARLSERLVAVEAESTARAAEADQLRGTLQQSEEDLSRTRDSLTKVSAALQQLRDAHVSKEGREGELAGALGQLNERLKNTETELQTARAGIAEKEARLEHRLNQKDETLRQKDAVVEQLGKEVALARQERESVVTRLSERLKEREAEIAKLSQELQASRGTVSGQQEAFDNRVKELMGGLQAQVQAAADKAVSLEQSLKERDLQLQQVQRSAGEKLEAQMLELEQMKQALKHAQSAPSHDDNLLNEVGKKLG